MSEPVTIEAEPQPQALVVREKAGAIGQALTVDELHRNLEFVKEVMRKEMREGQDYGKIPGTGDKPTLLQPGAQKLLLTFNLVEKVKREVLRDFPNLHREYEFTICVCAQNGKEWDGVGTCSTLEAKYRYRKQERRCPKCGKHNIIAGKEEYGGGWLCWKKKGGCGATFQYNDSAIQSQPSGRVEHDNPPDYWNTVRKMAFKRALVHASINATNTSDLWTQDLEEGAPADSGDEAPTPTENAPGRKAPTQATPSPAPAGSTPIATPKHLARLVEALASQRELVERYFRAIDWLLPTEPLEHLELRYVPVSKEQFDSLTARLEACQNGEPATVPYPPAEFPMAEKPKDEPEKSAGKQADWWRGVIVPIPHKDQKRDEYMKHPETIGQLYDLRHGNDEESQAARQRLWGFIEHYQPKGWEKRNGTKMPPSEADLNFRKALDACKAWHEQNHPEEKL